MASGAPGEFPWEPLPSVGTTPGTRCCTCATRAKWHEVARGLQLSLLGSAFLALVGVPGAVLAWVAAYGGSAWQARLSVQGEEAAAQVVGLALLAVAGLVGGGLILLGRWLCLVNAPQRDGAKELMLTCFLCSLTGAGLLAAAHYLGGDRNYGVFRRGPDALALDDFFRSAGTVQLLGLLLLLGSSLLFGRFLHGAARYFGDGPRAGRLDAYFVLLCFVIGGTGGVYLFPRGSEVRVMAFLVAAGCWLLCFLGNLFLVADARRGIATALAKRRLGEMPAVKGAPRRRRQPAPLGLLPHPESVAVRPPRPSSDAGHATRVLPPSTPRTRP